MTIGEKIKNRRIELGLSQDELAKKMGYKSRNAIYQFEQKDNMKLSIIEKFADALDTTPAYLMGWQEQLKEFSEEMGRQTKSVRDFAKTHTIDYNRIIEELIKQFGEKEVEHAIVFVNAYLKASPERQKIALEILRQSHQDDPLPHRLPEDTESATQ